MMSQCSHTRDDAGAGVPNLEIGERQLANGLGKLALFLVVAGLFVLTAGLSVAHTDERRSSVPEGAREALAALHTQHRAQGRTDVMLPAGPALLDYAAALTDHGAPFAARLLISTIIEDGGMLGSQAEIAGVRMGALAVLAQAYLASDDPVRAQLVLDLIDQSGTEAMSLMSETMWARLGQARADLRALAETSDDANAAREMWTAEAQSLFAELVGKQSERQELFARLLANFGANDFAAADTTAQAFIALVEPDDVLGTIAALLVARPLTIGTDAAPDSDLAAARPWLERVLDMPVAFLAAVPTLHADTKHPVETLILASAKFRQEAHFDARFATRLAERAMQVAMAAGHQDNLLYTAALEAHAGALDVAGNRPAAEAAWSRLIAHYEQLPDERVMPIEERRRYVGAISAFANLASAEPGREQDTVSAFVDALRIAEAGGDALVDLRADTLTVLGDFYSAQSRFDEAIGIYRSAVALSEQAGRAEEPDFVYKLAQLGSLEVQSGTFDQAAKTLVRARSLGALALSETDPAHARILDDLVAVYEGRGEEAPGSLIEAQQAAEAAQSGSPAPIVVRGQQFLGKIDEAYQAFFASKWDAAIGHAQAAHDLADLYGQPNWVVDALRVQAAIEMRRDNHVAALSHHRRVEALLATSPTITLAERQDNILAHMQTAVLAGANADGAASNALYEEAFGLAQKLNRAGVGSQLERANVRRSIGGRPVSGLLRRLQDEEDRRDGLATELTLRLTTGEPVTSTREAIEAANVRVAELQAEVQQQFPDYADHLAGSIASLPEAAAVLSDNEALIIFATRPVPTDTGVNQTGMALVLTRFGFAANLIAHDGDLAALSRRLRCAAARTDPLCQSGIMAANQRGAFQLDDGSADANPTGLPAFDYEAAYAAYEALMAPLPLDLALDGVDSLIVVPDSSLVAMPFHLMVREPTPPETGFADAPWLLRDAAVTIAPTVSSFIGLRRNQVANNRPARSGRFLGIGDPLIGRQATGPIDFNCDTVLDRSIEVASTFALDVSQRGVLDDVTALRDLAALPDTECELNATAGTFETEATLLLHDQANEAAIKQMSAEGRLSDYSVVSFATHGLIAGEIGANNAGLVLTPPAVPGPVDDGLLTSAEIAALELDADFVLLSACNTAAGDARDAEGLSGLASAFFFAGARNLLVSHWPVYSDAATQLTTGMFSALQERPDLSRAQALRASMLALLDDPSATERQKHPAYWAPFMIVGEGGAS